MSNSFLFILAALSVLICAIVMPAKGRIRVKSKATTLKSHMKQIATTVQMYHSEDEISYYPSNPKLIDIDQSLINEISTNNWHDLSLNSPYYFFPNEGKRFTHSSKIPLATNWEPLIDNGREFLNVVWEDGHVSTVTREQHSQLFATDFKALITFIIYKITLRNNQALQ